MIASGLLSSALGWARSVPSVVWYAVVIVLVALGIRHDGYRDAKREAEDRRRREQQKAMEKLESVKDTLDEKLEQTRKLDRDRPSVTDADSVPDAVARNIFRN